MPQLSLPPTSSLTVVPLYVPELACSGGVIGSRDVARPEPLGEQRELSPPAMTPSTSANQAHCPIGRDEGRARCQGYGDRSDCQQCLPDRR